MFLTRRRRPGLEAATRATSRSARLTNREAAAELCVTDKAIEYHLGNVYAKLGIRSRSRLRELVSSSAEARKGAGMSPTHLPRGVS